MTQPVQIAGVGMVPFVKPGANAPYPQMAETAAREALADAGIAYEQVQQAFVGYVYGDSTSGQKALYRLGSHGLPVFNVNNNCATGASALFLARQAVASGTVDCALALGFEQMKPGALGVVFEDRPSPFEDFDLQADALVGMKSCPWRCATSVARVWRTCASTARRSRPLPPSAPRPAGMQRTTRWPCCARN